MLNRSAALGFMGVVLALSSCDRAHKEPPVAASASSFVVAPSAAAPSQSVPAPNSGAPPTSAARRPAPSAGAPVELSEAEKEAELRYKAALERGRHATLAKNYDAADIAFTEALTARKNDTRALGERGFARMQAGRSDAAEDDFLTADGRTKDLALAAQIFYNQGLLAERRGNMEGAKVAYARSEQAHPTSAAKSKLAALGGNTCTAAFVPLSQPLQHYANWVAFWETLGEMDTYKTDDEVKKALQAGDCQDFCAVGGAESWHVALPSPSGLDVLRDVDHGGFSRCSTYPHFKLERSGSILWITTTNEEFEVALCDPHCNNDDGLCPTCCADGPSHRYDTFLDFSTRRATLRVSQYSPNGAQFEPLPVTLDPHNLVQVSGGGCTRGVSLGGN